MNNSKVRVWNGYDRYLNCPVYCDGEWFADSRDFEDWIPLENYKVEWTLNRKDKNGVEIFHGDIIKLPENTYDIKYEPGQLVLVGWSTDKCGFRPFCTTHSDYSMINHKECEVVGNINENKELLKV